MFEVRDFVQNLDHQQYWPSRRKGKSGSFLEEKGLEIGKTPLFPVWVFLTLLCLQMFTGIVLDQATWLLLCPADLKRFPRTPPPGNPSSRRRHLTEDLTAHWHPFRGMQQEPSLNLLFFWIPPPAHSSKAFYCFPKQRPQTGIKRDGLPFPQIKLWIEDRSGGNA